MLEQQKNTTMNPFNFIVEYYNGINSNPYVTLYLADWYDHPAAPVRNRAIGFGLAIYEEIGMAIVNPRAINGISMKH